MAKLLIQFNHPADAAAFEEHYFNTHVPIFAETPGIKGVSFSKGPISPLVGTADYFLIADVTFDSMAELRAGLASKPAQDAIADLPNFAEAGVTIMAYDTRD